MKITKKEDFLPERHDYTEEDARFMELAIKLSEENVDLGGGPFGAVIVRDGELIATGPNRVVPNNDPTAHAEVTAIRNACQKLGTFQLDGCTVYSSCEPCPMCLGAIYWAHIDRMFYGNTKTDAKNIGFDDSFIYDEIDLRIEDRRLKAQQLLPEEAIKAFQAWENDTDKIPY